VPVAVSISTKSLVVVVNLLWTTDLRRSKRC
jgi:hypothetical protein